MGSWWRWISSTTWGWLPAAAAISPLQAGCCILTTNGRFQPTASPCPQMAVCFGRNMEAKTIIERSQMERGSLVCLHRATEPPPAKTAGRGPHLATFSSRGNYAIDHSKKIDQTRTTHWRSKWQRLLHGQRVPRERPLQSAKIATGDNETSKARANAPLYNLVTLRCQYPK